LEFICKIKMSKEYSKYNDKQLFESCRNNHISKNELFTELYTRYSQRIYAYCLRVLSTIEDAKDVFQESFISFYKSDKFNNLEFQNTCVFGYLLIVTRNLCLNHKRTSVELVNIDDFLIGFNDSRYEEKELLKLISMALEFLDIQYREPFVLRQYEGLSYTEIAEIIGCNESTIRNRVWRAKDKIREILAPYIDDLNKQSKVNA